MAVEIIPREVLFGNPEKISPQLSPGKKYLAYIAPHNGVLNVWVRNLNDNTERVVTNDTRRGIRSFFWSYHPGILLFMQDVDGDENWHLYRCDIENTEPNQVDLTPFDGVQARLLSLEPEYPQTVIVSLNKKDARLFDVYSLSLESNELTLLCENPGNAISWLISEAQQVRGFTEALPDGGYAFSLRQQADDDFLKFIEWSFEDSSSHVIGFAPGEKSLYVKDSRDHNSLRLTEVSISDQSQKVLLQDERYDTGRVLLHKTGRHLQAASVYKERAHWHIFDDAIKEDFALLEKASSGDFFLVSRDLADTTWIVAYLDDHRPVSYYRYDRQSKQAEFLFSNKPALDQYQLAEMKPVSYRARDGLLIEGYLSLPVKEKPVGMVLNVHGGPWGRDSWGLDAEAQWFTNRGYACLQVNFRGSTGYGKDFLNAGNREWGAKMHDDLVDAVNWAIEKGYAEAGKVAIYGGSYGGYAALAGAAFTPDVFCCAVDIVGPSNIITLIKSIPPYWAPLKKTFDLRVGDVDTEEEFLKSRSPLFSVDQVKIPMLIAQGKNDPRVKQAESEQIVAALKEKGKEVEYLLYEDEGHGFARPENRIDFYQKAEKFLARHLGGRHEP